MRTGALIEAAVSLIVIGLILWGMAGCGASLFRSDATIEQPVYTPHCIHVEGGQALWRPVSDKGWKCHGEDI